MTQLPRTKCQQQTTTVHTSSVHHSMQVECELSGDVNPRRL